MITFATKQLNRKHKHASDFGVTANNNGPGREAFRLAMIAHVNASTTQTVTAGYRGVQGSTRRRRRPSRLATVASKGLRLTTST